MSVVLSTTLLNNRDDVDNREIAGGSFDRSTRVLTDRMSVTAKVAWQNRESDGFSHEDPSIGRLQQSRFGESIADEWINYHTCIRCRPGCRPIDIVDFVH